MNLDQIIDGCIKENRQAQQALYNLYKNALFVLSLKYCRNEAEAEDNLHNAFIEIFSNIKNYRGKGSFEGWIKRIAINKAISSYKKGLQYLPVDDVQIADSSTDDYEIDVSLDYLLSLIQGLPNQYRLVFCLFELDEYPHKEIAAMLSISESTSKSNLHKAKAILKKKISTKHPITNTSNGEK